MRFSSRWRASSSTFAPAAPAYAEVREWRQAIERNMCVARPFGSRRFRTNDAGRCSFMRTAAASTATTNGSINPVRADREQFGGIDVTSVAVLNDVATASRPVLWRSRPHRATPPVAQPSSPVARRVSGAQRYFSRLGYRDARRRPGRTSSRSRSALRLFSRWTRRRRAHWNASRSCR